MCRVTNSPTDDDASPHLILYSVLSEMVSMIGTQYLVVVKID